MPERRRATASCWGAAGAARACYEAALSYAAERVQFDKPLAAFQLTQAKLAEMAV